ncbi:MAG: FAD binding domain-containing protein [Chloroflexota bacterium]
MIPANLAYQAPATLAEAIALLAGTPGATVLAGGQSLIPALTTGRASASLLVDLRRVPGLAGITRSGGTLRVGAATTLDALASSAEVAGGWGALADAARAAGDAQVRNRATVGGSLAAGHPAGDLIAAAIALGGVVVAAGPGGERRIPGAALVVGPYRTSLAAGEIVVALEVPAASGASAYVKQRHPGSGYAIVGVAAAVATGADGAVSAVALAITGAGDAPVAVDGAALAGRSPAEAATAAPDTVAAAGLRATTDLAASAEYRAHLAGVLAGRAISLAGSRLAR